MPRQAKPKAKRNAVGAARKQAKPGLITATEAKRRMRKTKRKADERDAATANKKAPGNPYRKPRAALGEGRGNRFRGDRPPTSKKREPVIIDPALKLRAERLDRRVR